MIVPKMNMEEVRNEFFLDFNALEARSRHRFANLWRDFRRSGLQYQKIMEEYKSVHHNRWLTFYHLTYGDCNAVHVLVYYDDVGLKALNALKGDKEHGKFIVRYNSHFFNRINERLNLKLVKPDHILRYFYKHNFVIQNHAHLEKREEEFHIRVFRPVEGGVILGFLDHERGWLEIKTFVADHMLRKNQVELAEQLRIYDEPGIYEDDYGQQVGKSAPQ